MNFRGDSVIVHQIPMRLKEYASSEEKNWKEILWSPFMKDKDDLALEAVFVCTAEPAAADWLPPASLTLRLKTCRVPLSLHTANHRRFGDSAMLWMSAWSRPLRTCKFRRSPPWFTV